MIGEAASKRGRAAPAETASHDEPQLYLASLSDYNAGRLHGVWLPADDLDGLHRGLAIMLAASPTTRRTGEAAEEWAIHDYSGFGSEVRLDEHEDLASVALLARGIAEHGSAFAAWWTNCEPELPDDRDEQDERWQQLEEQFLGAYLGEHDSLTAFAEEFLTDLGVDLEVIEGVPESLRNYVTIDIDGYARDLAIGGDITTATSEEGVHVFNCK